MLRRIQLGRPVPDQRTLPMSFFKNPVLPVRQAPMAGGITTPKFVAACAEAGFWPVYASGYRDPQQVSDDIKQIIKLTRKPIEVNLFVPTPRPQMTNQLRAQIRAYFTKINEFRTHLGLPCEENIPSIVFSETCLEEQTLNEIAEVILREKEAVKAVSFTFGCLKPEFIRAFKQAGLYVLGSATSLQEASELLNAGVDAIVAQGYGAGGHRACFSGDDSCLSTLELVQQLAELNNSINCPIIAAGNIMDAQDIRMHLDAGADAVQMGTALLATQQSGASQAYKKALEECKKRSGDLTTVTSVYTGRPARGIRTTFMRKMEGLEIPPKPIPHELSTKFRKEAAEKDFFEYMSLWAGEGVNSIQIGLSVQAFYDDLLESMNDLLEKRDKLSTTNSCKLSLNNKDKESPRPF